MDKSVPLSQAKYDEIVARLHYCETDMRSEISNAIRTAKEFGDLSENAEYSAAKDAQERLEIEIANLSKIISESYPIDSSTIDTKKISIGNTIKVFDKLFNEELTYTMVSSTEASSAEGKLSDRSPIGAMLIGKVVGDVVKIKTPNGKIREITVLEITIA
ncbi:MAG: transcription elongation factor GreA [Bacillota bacterium]